MRLLTVTLWILAGAALAGGAYWLFLITPESTIGSLAVSAVLLISTLFLAGVTASGAVVGWRDGVSTSQARRSLVAAPAVVPGAFVIGFLWWLVGSLADRMIIDSGPINAWFIATLGWDDVSWLFTTVAWLALWMKWVVAPLLALSLMAGVVGEGWQALSRTTWMTQSLAPRRLGAATLIFAALVATPGLYLAPWRPGGLPATVIELAFTVVKLAITALLMATGVALIIRQATR